MQVMTAFIAFAIAAVLIYVYIPASRLVIAALLFIEGLVIIDGSWTMKITFSLIVTAIQVLAMHGIATVWGDD